MNATDSYPSMTGNREMAAGVFKQAKRDLRRFHRAVTPLKRELYSDAYSWVMSENAEWPFSFRNVCRLFNLSPEEARQELLGDLAFRPLGGWTRRCGRTAGRRRTSINPRFPDDRDAIARYA